MAASPRARSASSWIEREGCAKSFMQLVGIHAGDRRALLLLANDCQAAGLIWRTMHECPGLCCIWSTGGMPKPLLAEGSDRQSQLVERDRHPPGRRFLDRELVVPAAKVLDEGVSGDHDPGAVLLPEPAHRS